MLFSSFALLFAASSTLAAPVPSWKREVPQGESYCLHDRSYLTLQQNTPMRTSSVPSEMSSSSTTPTTLWIPSLGSSVTQPHLLVPETLTTPTAFNKVRELSPTQIVTLCFLLATADQAFSNAKAAGDIAGMTVALQYRAIERNTGQVGLASVICSSIPAVNPEIAAITQHQDPASPNAAAINKGIVLELARQIAAIGGNPLDALKTGTFSPGQIGDPTAKGNSCNDENDANGCINTLGLLVLDATEEEILAVGYSLAPIPVDSLVLGCWWWSRQRCS